jgi:hypothetical protein
MRGPGQALNVDLHQTLRGKADHLAQKIRVGALLHKRAEVHHVVGHRGFLGSCSVLQPNPTEDSR